LRQRSIRCTTPVRRGRPDGFTSRTPPQGAIELRCLTVQAISSPSPPSRPKAAGSPRSIFLRRLPPGRLHSGPRRQRLAALDASTSIRIVSVGAKQVRFGFLLKKKSAAVGRINQPVAVLPSEMSHRAWGASLRKNGRSEPPSLRANVMPSVNASPCLAHRCERRAQRMRKVDGLLR
jgi:hypothetical protein